jgi:2-amino-4-hydroxy-6-hydroxymethyldihydropteridine diphosphokinase
MHSCLIGLGANLGNRRETLEEAVARLGRQPGIRVTAKSPWRETAAIGGPPGQPPYLNGAAVLETSLAPEALWEVLRQVEADLGRRRAERWGPRPIDLDMLLYERLILSTPSLVLPHPRMAWRRFVLQPAAAVAGSMIHPTIGWTVARLLEHLDTAVPYVAISGPIAAGKTRLAERLAAQTGARLLAEPLDLEQLASFYADPAGRAWQIELQFVETRSRLLAPDLLAGGEGGPRRLTISDFWFDQSLAFARVWLSPEQFLSLQPVWEQARRRVVQPKLIILLDAPGEALRARVLRRGRPCEEGLDAAQLERIRQSLLAQAAAPDLGPVLRIPGGSPEGVFAEALAAIQSME